jgi:hypothetical protein
MPVEESQACATAIAEAVVKSRGFEGKHESFAVG